MSNYPRPDEATLLEIYRKVATIKTNDERIIREMKAGKLVTPYYSGRGQEIIPSALSMSLNDDDYLCTIYRGVHDMVAKGFPLDIMWAELAGRVDRLVQGQGRPDAPDAPGVRMHGHDRYRRLVPCRSRPGSVGRPSSTARAR